MSREAATTWARRIEAWRQSGQSQAAYCRDHGFKAGTFSYWLRKERSEMGVRVGREGSALVPVVVREAGAAWSIEVVLPNGIRLQVPGGADAAHVRALTEVLLRC